MGLGAFANTQGQKTKMQDIRFYKLLVFINALIPLALLGWDFARGNLGTNPIEYFLRTTGTLTLVFLLITLAVTPLRKIFGQKIPGCNQLIKYRRMLGLYAFFYCLLHFSTYTIFDRGFNIFGIPGDIWQRPFIAIGMASFFMMIPLAVTSTNAMVKRLGGKRWASLHKLTYAIAIGGVWHYYLIVKSDITYPAAFGAVLALLLGYRVYQSNKQANVPSLKTAK